MTKKLNIKVTVTTVPHPNLKAAINTVAEIVVRDLIKEREPN